MHSPEQVLEVLERHGPSRGKLFEGSCGRGKSANRLASLGYQVTCSSLVGRPQLAPGIECREGVDLNRGLPFDPESFDVAVLQEVIEHLENPAHVVREFNRILRPGGRWVLTSPNASCLRSRLHFLFTGFLKGRRRPGNYNLPPGEYSNLFIPFLPTLHYLLWSYGFRVVATGRSARKASSLVLYVLLFPLVQVLGRLYLRPQRGYESARQDEATRELGRLMLSRHVLLDENLVLLLEKRHGLEGMYAPQAG